MIPASAGWRDRPVHPHYYSTMVEWGRAFGVPVWLHAADRAACDPGPTLPPLLGRRDPAGAAGLTLHRLGGHFAGGAVAHWRRGAGGRGALLSGDILQVMPDRRHVGFMRSYPCLIPLPPAEVRRMAGHCDGLEWDAIYGAFHEREIVAGGKAALARSARAIATGWRGWSSPDRRRRPRPQTAQTGSIRFEAATALSAQSPGYRAFAARPVLDLRI